MNASLRRAAWTALCCLWSACGDGIQVPPEPPALSMVAAAEPSQDEPANEAAPLPDPDAPTTTLQAPLEAWPIALSTEQLASIDDALFVDDALLVAGRAGDQVVVMRLHRSIGVWGVAAAPQTPGERFARVRPEASPVALVHSGQGALALWVADGHLEAIEVATGAELAALEPRRLSGEEGGQLTGPMLAAESADGALACAKDKLGPTCFSFDGKRTLTGVNLITRRTAVGDPLALVAIDSGFMLVLGTCRSGSCTRVDLTAVQLDEQGAPGKLRDLPLVQIDRGTAFIADGDGFVLVARRVGAGEHSAWRVTPASTRELDGRYSRVVGGFAHDDRTLLLERAHLKMRNGFPVRGYQVRPLTEANARAGRGRSKVEREALPDEIAALLPSDADQRFSAHGEALVFVAPPRKGALTAAIVRLMER